MDKSAVTKISVAAGLLVVAVLVWFLTSGGGSNTNRSGASGNGTGALFYDLSEKELFTAPYSAVPPIKGMNDDEEDGVRAYVISTLANRRDESSWKIIYLEQVVPKAKALLEANQRALAAKDYKNFKSVPRDYRDRNSLVKRVDGDKWERKSSRAGKRIVAEFFKAIENEDAVLVIPE